MNTNERPNEFPEISQQLRREGLKIFSNSSGFFRMQCPFCYKEGLTLRVNIRTQEFFCTKCREGGKIDRFIKLYKALSWTQAWKYLTEELEEIRKQSKLHEEELDTESVKGGN